MSDLFNSVFKLMPVDSVETLSYNLICACMHHFFWDRKWEKKVTHDMSLLGHREEKKKVVGFFSVMIWIHFGLNFLAGLILLPFEKEIFTLFYPHRTLP